RGQPVLVGTASIETSELISGMLQKQKIEHQVLNAKHHAREASIIAEAGRPGAVTIATNMAGRGTDIQLGGNLEMLLQESGGEKHADKLRKQVEEDKERVLTAGGLCVIGTERHESRRIDNQLRGRSGRQGDPGYTKFFLSLEDDLMRIFGADKKMDFIMRKMGEPGEPITAPILSRVLEKAQSRVEGRNFEIRKNLLKFDDVMNDQRKVIFEQRIEIMESEDVSATLADMREELVEALVDSYMPERSYEEEWDFETLEKEVHRLFAIQPNIRSWAGEEGNANEEITTKLKQSVEGHIGDKESQYGIPTLRLVEKRLLLFTLDELWKDHLLSLDHLRQGIGLRAYAQKDPLNEYKREAFMLFDAMLGHLREVVISRLSHLELQPETGAEALVRQRAAQKMVEGRRDPAMQGQEQAQPGATVIKRVDGPRDPANPETWGKVGRNEACPCGSGLKYKHCHGKIES
ncbi:MAG: SEC-C domain-containing protein, partial [Rickettsiales bacterium]|nr:SEC-C domain-containing protein [Rickettsiales bacterium]